MADKMAAQGCVNCHNAHPQTPKNDWKLGDVRGVLEVTSNVDHQIAAGAALTRKILIGAVLAGILMIALAIFTAMRVSKPLGRIKTVIERLAGGDKEAQADETETGRGDEIGDIARTVQTFPRRDGRKRPAPGRSALGQT